MAIEHEPGLENTLSSLPETTQTKIVEWARKNALPLESDIVRDVIERNLMMHRAGLELLSIGKVRELYGPRRLKMNRLG